MMDEKPDGLAAVLICQVLTGNCTCLPQGSPDEHYANRPKTDCARASCAAVAWNNAQLTIAAPDLLAACEEFVSKYSACASIMPQMKAAIAKAKGESDAQA
jgi:hypothetical protein